MLSIRSNSSADIALRLLRQTDAKLSLAMAKLSAGRRVLSARDDPASLAIGARLGAEVSGMTQAKVNAGQASSMLQIADGGMENINKILTRMKTLTVQAGSGQLTAGDRSALDTEFQALASEIDRIAAATDFGGVKLLDGTAGAISVKVGTGTSPTADNISVDLNGASTSDLSVDGLYISSREGADAANVAIDNAIDQVQSLRVGIGADQNRLDYAASNIATSIENTEAARSNLLDLDVARGTADLAGWQTRMQTGIAMLAYANADQKNILKLLV